MVKLRDLSSIVYCWVGNIMTPVPSEMLVLQNGGMHQRCRHLKGSCCLEAVTGEHLDLDCSITSGQIITTSQDLHPQNFQKVAEVSGNPQLFQGNLGW